MSPYPLHALPRRGAIVREQLRSTGLAVRREGLLLAGLLTTFTLYLAWTSMHGVHGQVPFVPEAAYPMMALALLAPMAVWKGEDPARRGYHWAMPVPVGEHAVTKSLAGLAWLLAATALYMGWLLALAAASGGRIGTEGGYFQQVTDGVASHEFLTVDVAPWRWLVPFTAATILYLFGSALTLLSRYPWRWLGGGVVGLMFVGNLRVSHNEPNPLARLVEWVWEAYYGLGAAMTGQTRTGSVLQMGESTLVSQSSFNPSLGAWMVSTWLWLAVALSVFLFAAYRQPER